MTGHGAKFGRKKEDAIVALLTTRTVEEAARVVGVSTKTLLRWMKEPEFDTAYRAAKRAAFGQTIASAASSLQRSCDDAGQGDVGARHATGNPSKGRGQHLGPHDESDRDRRP